MTGAALWAVVLLPAVVGGLLCLGARRPAPVAVTTAAVAHGLAVVVALARPAGSVPFVAGVPFALSVDGLSALVLPAVSAVTLLVLVSAAGTKLGASSRFCGLMLLFAAAVAVTATAANLVTLLVGWEVMGACSYALIGLRWAEPDRVAAGAVAFLTTRTADLGLYAAAAAALAGGAGLDLAALPQAEPGWRDVAAAGVLVAALGKAAQLPFSFWLSRAMAGPSPVSALLHSAAMVAMGGYLLLRTAPLLAATGWAATAAAWAGALTALLLGAVALAQRDLKQLLAASTAAQLGFVVLAAGVGATAGGAAHLLAHAATKALLFLAAGAWLDALGTRQLPALRGAGRRWPLVGACFALGALALAGLPPLSLWATKDAVLAAALDTSPALYAVALAAAALSAAYAGKALVVLRRPAGDEQDGWDAEQPGSRRIGRLQQAPLVVLAAGAALLGLLALPPLGTVLRRALDSGTVPAAGPVELVASGALAVVVLLAAVRWRVLEPRWAAGWLGLEAAAYALAVRPVLRLADGLARFDDRVVDRAVEAAARGAVTAAGVAARVDVRGVDGAVEALARRVRAAGELARRPQTGLTHQYYLQAVGVLAVAVAVLLLAR